MPIIQQILERILIRSRSPILRRQLLQWLYARKGMRFGGVEAVGPYFLMTVDEAVLPAEQPLWNVTAAQYRVNCERISLARCTLRPGDTVVDIGAGLGEEAVVYATLVGPGGSVHCLEPQPAVYAVLQEVAARQPHFNVHTYPYALYEADAPVAIGGADEPYEAARIGTGGGSTVPGIRLDTLLSQVGADRIRLLKVNVEGAERYLLNEAFLPSLRRIDHLAIACHDFRFRQEGDPFFQTRRLVTDFFTAHGFSVTSQQSGEEWLDDWLYISPPEKV